MANEISTNLNVSVSVNSQLASGAVNNQMDASNNAFIGNEQTIGTSSETIFLGDVGSTPVFLFVRNMDDTNYVEVDSASTMDKFPQKLLPGRGVYLFPQSGTIYCRANTATCRIWVVAA